MIRNVLSTTFKVILLSVLASIITLVVSSLTASSAAQAFDPDQAGAALIGIIIVSFVDVIILLSIIRLSSWSGWALIAGLAFSYFGVKTFIGQIEALAFLTPLAQEIGSGAIPVIQMPVQLILGQFVIGFVLAVSIVPLGVWMMGKARTDNETVPRIAPSMGAGQWILKLLAVIVFYELLYFAFGYYIAWQSPALLEFYQGTNPGSFIAQMRNVIQFTPLLLFLQAIRALLWVAFALPVIMMLRQRLWLGALMTAIFLAIPMNIQHVIPNPFMPSEVRMVHFIETASSNFLLGVFLFWLFHRSHRSFSGVFGLAKTKEDHQMKGGAVT